MNIVTLNPNLLDVNARIMASSAMPPEGLTDSVVGDIETLLIPPARLSGAVRNGYDRVTAQIAPGTTGTIELSFEIVTPSISALTFDLYRMALKEILQAAAEEAIGRAAGIGVAPPPEPASCMANYAQQLFSKIVFDGGAVADRNRTFSAEQGASDQCLMMLTATRLLPVTKVKFSGALTASSASPATQQAAAYIPITAIEYNDGLTIPFAGYSNNVLVDYGGLKLLDIPRHFWAELEAES